MYRRFALQTVSLSVLAFTASGLAFAAPTDDPVSFYTQVRPIFARSCIACHKPEKKKGKLDLTTFEGVAAGGENGPIIDSQHIPAKSSLIDQISPHGQDKPAMPEKGEPLPPADVAVVARWISRGAINDTPADAVVRAGFARAGPTPPTTAPSYRAVPAVGAIGVSFDGALLAVAGRGEVLLLSAEDFSVKRRLPFGSSRINSVIFCDDGKTLVAAGGAPGQFGQVQAWSLPAVESTANWQTSGDTLFGLSVSPDGKRVAFGCADRTVRVISLGDGKEELPQSSHTDWVFGTAFTPDGKLLSVSRDKSLKLTDLPGGKVVDVNEPLEAGLCLARNPAKDQAVVGCANGAPRLYKSADPQTRTEQKKDPNLLKDCERVNGPVNAVAFTRDGEFFAAAGTGELKVYKNDGSRTGTISGISGPVYAVAFSPDGQTLFSAGFDGTVRAYQTKSGKLLREAVPAPFVGK